MAPEKPSARDGVLTIDGIHEVDTGNNPGQLYEFPYSVSYDTDGSYTISVANSVPVQLGSGYAVVVNQLTVVFDKDGLIEGITLNPDAQFKCKVSTTQFIFLRREGKLSTQTLLSGHLCHILPIEPCAERIQ